jgi:hypothetical protein
VVVVRASLVGACVREPRAAAKMGATNRNLFAWPKQTTIDHHTDTDNGRPANTSWIRSHALWSLDCLLARAGRTTKGIARRKPARDSEAFFPPRLERKPLMWWSLVEWRPLLALLICLLKKLN